MNSVQMNKKSGKVKQNFMLSFARSIQKALFIKKEKFGQEVTDKNAAM